MEPTVTTKDLVLAASLSAIGYPLTGLDVSVGGRKGNIGVFTFSGTGIEASEANYHSGDLLVEPRRFHLCLKDLKARANEPIRQ